MLHFQLSSTRYQEVQIYNHLKSNSAIKQATIKIGMIMLQKEAIMCNFQIDTFAVRKDSKGGHW